MINSETILAAKTFYFVCPPGLEEIVRAELLDFFGEAKLSTVDFVGTGGFEAELPLAVGLAANLVLKTPTRILLRLNDFGCRDFPKLFKKARGFDWSPWLSAGEPINVEASTHGSWLKIKKRIEATVFDGIKAAGFANGGLQKNSEKSVYVRFINNICFISLDTSGEILHKRGYRSHTPDAPIRENLAAGLLESLLVAMPPPAGRLSNLVDPMAGSGTFLIEAATRRVPNFGRDYAFGKFPIMYGAGDLVNEFASRDLKAKVFTTCLGVESDPETIKVAQRAFQDAKVKNVKVLAGDIFSLKSGLMAPEGTTNYLICNPPYGQRLKVKEPLPAYYSRLMRACELNAQPACAGFLWPDGIKIKDLKLPPGWEHEKTLKLSNGGIPVRFEIFSAAR